MTGAIDYKKLIEDSFTSICINMEHGAYEDALDLICTLLIIKEYLTETQLDQLDITTKRLSYLLEEKNT